MTIYKTHTHTQIYNSMKQAHKKGQSIQSASQQEMDAWPISTERCMAKSFTNLTQMRASEWHKEDQWCLLACLSWEPNLGQTCKSKQFPSEIHNPSFLNANLCTCMSAWVCLCIPWWHLGLARSCLDKKTAIKGGVHFLFDHHSLCVLLEFTHC